MPIKDKVRYNEYMKGYLQKQRDKTKGKKMDISDDFDATVENKTIVLDKITEDKKPPVNIQNPVTKDLMKLGKEIFKDSETGEPDKIIQVLSKVLEYAPMVVKLIQGFATSQKAFNDEQGNRQEKRLELQAPDGWLNMPPMQRLAKKYTNTDWYNAGEAYDAAKANGGINPAINTNYVDKGYTEPRRGQQPAQTPAPNSMAELNAKYPEPPLVDDSPPPKDDKPKVKKTSAEIKQEIKDKVAKQNGTNPEIDKVEDKTNIEEIQAVLQADNAKYIEVALKFLDGMKLEDFKEKIKNIEGLIKQYKPFIGFLPAQTRELLKNTPSEDLEKLFKERCKKKFDWLVKAKKKKKILDLFEEIKKILG